LFTTPVIYLAFDRLAQWRKGSPVEPPRPDAPVTVVGPP
jgi:hypothetical protein